MTDSNRHKRSAIFLGSTILKYLLPIQLSGFLLMDTIQIDYAWAYFEMKPASQVNCMRK